MNENMDKKEINVGVEKNPIKEYIVCVRYTAHSWIDAVKNLEYSLRDDPDFVVIAFVRKGGDRNGNRRYNEKKSRKHDK